MTNIVTPSRPFDRDKFHMVPRIQAAAAAQLALFQVQDEEPEVMALGVAVLFAALSARTGMDPHDLFTAGHRVLHGHDFGDRKTNDSLQSLRDFAGLRVAGKEVTIS